MQQDNPSEQEEKSKDENKIIDSEALLINSHSQKEFSDDFSENGKRVLIILPEESEMSEVVQMADVMRRGGMNVTIASLNDSCSTRSSNNIFCHVDATLSNASKELPYNVLVLPGGLIGAKLLGESKMVGVLLREYEEKHRWIVAIGDSPPVLRKHFIGTGKTLTCHPLIKHKIEGSNYMKYKYIDDDTFVDGKIITCKGGPHTMQCALNLIHLVCGRNIAENVAEKLLTKYDDGYCTDCCGNCKYCCREDKKKIYPDIADRFACINCCSVDDPDVINWEEEKVLKEILEKEDMIIYKLRREELKDENKNKHIEKEELEQQIEEDKKEMENWRQKWANQCCVSQREYDKYIKEYTERDESCYYARMKKIHDRLYKKIEQSKRRHDMVDVLRNLQPAEMDAVLAEINSQS